MDFKSEIRSIKLGIVSNSFDIKISPPKIGGFFSFKRGDTIIKDLLKSGAILTGSRALKCYKVSNRDVLDREPDDWDFIVTNDILFKICDKYNLSKFIDNDENGDYYAKVEDELIRFTSNYGGATRVLSTNITLICKDEVGFVETSKGRITNLVTILDEKYKLCGKELFTEPTKHDLDLKQIITRFNSL